MIREASSPRDWIGIHQQSTAHHSLTHAPTHPCFSGLFGSTIDLENVYVGSICGYRSGTFSSVCRSLEMVMIDVALHMEEVGAPLTNSVEFFSMLWAISLIQHNNRPSGVLAKTESRSRSASW